MGCIEEKRYGRGFLEDDRTSVQQFLEYTKSLQDFDSGFYRARDFQTDGKSQAFMYDPLYLPNEKHYLLM